MAKITRYFWGWKLLFHALMNCVRGLLVPMLFPMVIVVFNGCTHTVIEHLRLDPDDPGMWNLPGVIFSTYNYADSISIEKTGAIQGEEPVSEPAQIFASLVMFTELMFISMPLSMVGRSFSETWFNQDRIPLVDKGRSRISQQGYTVEDLREVFEEEPQNRIFRREGMVVNVTADGERLRGLGKLFEAFPDRFPANLPRDAAEASSSWAVPLRELRRTSEGIVVPTQVNYVGKGANLYREGGYQLHG